MSRGKEHVSSRLYRVKGLDRRMAPGTLDTTMAQTKPRCRWYQFTLRSMLIGTAIFALLLGLGIHYRFHLLLVYGSARGTLPDVQAVPNGPMPDSPPPADWVHCRFGSLEFDVPAELTKDVVAPENGATLLGLCADSRKIIMTLPTDHTDIAAYLQSMGVPRQGQGLSGPRLRLACCQASASDFRWSMAPEEVHWLTWRIAMGSLIRLKGDSGWIETLFRDDLEGVVYLGGTSASLDWQSIDSKASGYINFVSYTADVDPAWVRPVCQSVRCTGECFPERMTQEKVRSLFEVISK
jgi:hypothetical protein